VGDEHLAVGDDGRRELGKQSHAVRSGRVVGRRAAEDVVPDVLRIEGEQLRLNAALLVRVSGVWQ